MVVMGTATYSLPALPLNQPLSNRDTDRLLAYSRQVARNNTNAAGILAAADRLEAAMVSIGPLHDRINAMTDEQLNRWGAR